MQFTMNMIFSTALIEYSHHDGRGPKASEEQIESHFFSHRGPSKSAGSHTFDNVGRQTDRQTDRKADRKADR